MNITAYLVFNGTAEEAAGFYADALGGRVENLCRYDSLPAQPGMPDVAEEDKQKIMHCCVTFPGGSMGIADTLPSDPRDFGKGGYMLTVNCDSAGQAETIYANLSVEAQNIPCELSEAFFAQRYGEIIDRFGVRWAVMYE